MIVKVIILLKILHLLISKEKKSIEDQKTSPELF